MISNYDIAKKIAKNISLELNFDDEKEEVVAYGIFGLLQIILSIIMVAIIGLFFGVVKEALVVSIVMATLRKSSGGVHATSPLRCMIIGTIMCVGVAKLILMFSIEIPILVIINVLVFFMSYYLIYKVVPVDTPNKPIKKIEKKIRLRRISLVNVTMFLGIIILFMCLYNYYGNYCYIIYSNCISIGIFLQVITLTKFGHRLFNNIDAILSKIIN